MPKIVITKQCVGECSSSYYEYPTCNVNNLFATAMAC